MVVGHGALFRADDDVHTTGDIMLLGAKGCANEPFPLVAHHRIADLFTNGQTQSGMPLVVSNGPNNQHAVPGVMFAPINGVELMLAA